MNQGTYSRENLEACRSGSGTLLNLNVSYQGRDALHQAIRANDMYAVDYLISVGADVNSQDKDGATVLTAAGGT
jgi:ankyrin repeat protein